MGIFYILFKIYASGSDKSENYFLRKQVSNFSYIVYKSLYSIFLKMNEVPEKFDFTELNKAMANFRS